MKDYFLTRRFNLVKVFFFAPRTKIRAEVSEADKQINFRTNFHIPPVPLQVPSKQDSICDSKIVNNINKHNNHKMIQF